MSLCLFEITSIDIIVIIAFIMSLRKKKLTMSGALSALFIGISVSFAGFEYLIIMLAFFVSSTKATDIHREIKRQLLGDSYTKEKQRNATQVLCKGFFPTIISLIIAFKYDSKMFLFSTENQALKFLYGIYIGFYVSANADTWASELGINSNALPIYICSFHKVPKGINGAVSLYGTVMSVLGGGFIAFTSVVCSMLRKFEFVPIENALEIIILGMFCGFLGSMIDSILGATLQISIYDNEKKCVVDKEEVDMKSIDLKRYKIFGRDYLNNSMVNLITGVTTSLISGVLFYLIL